MKKTFDLILKKKYNLTRKDGRRDFEHRKINFKLDVIPSSICSFYLEFGSNKFLFSLFGPKYFFNLHQHNSCNFKTVFLEPFEKSINFNFLKKINIFTSTIMDYISINKLFPSSKFFILIRKIKNDGNFSFILPWGSQMLIKLANIPIKFSIKFNTLCLVKNRIFLDPTSEELFFAKTHLEIISEGNPDCNTLVLIGLNFKSLLLFENAMGFIGNNFFNFVFSKIIPTRYSFFFF